MFSESLVFRGLKPVIFGEQRMLGRRGFFGEIPVGGGVGFGGDFIRLVSLELRGMTAALRHLLDHQFGLVHIALMVHADFGDDIGLKRSKCAKRFSNIFKGFLHFCGP